MISGQKNLIRQSSGNICQGNILAIFLMENRTLLRGLLYSFLKIISSEFLRITFNTEGHDNPVYKTKTLWIKNP